ncbi:GntR family transcriptional regulator [Dactylosporangium sp. NPDC000521]|uniref:GntR family transcriptional regulator n=1 Tax=Dactylosporangium sp. NPDC000521 TaxID=3363975 RepID=UPI00368AAD49
MTSKYDRIAADLRRMIDAGELAPGQKMPSETVLLGKYNVSLLTMRRALAVLEASGVIEKRHGVGNFVRKARARVTRTTERYQWEKDRALLPESKRRSTGATERDTGLTKDDLSFQAHYSVIEADEELAGVFKAPVGTRLLKRTYRTETGDDSAPIALSASYLPYEIVAANPKLLDAANEPWPGGTHHQLRTVGVEVDRIVDEVTARPPFPEEAEQLGIDAAGVSVISLRKISIDTSGRVVDVADVLLSGDRTQLVYTTQLNRWPTDRPSTKGSKRK